MRKYFDLELILSGFHLRFVCQDFFLQMSGFFLRNCILRNPDRFVRIFVYGPNSPYPLLWPMLESMMRLTINKKLRPKTFQKISIFRRFPTLKAFVVSASSAKSLVTWPSGLYIAS